MPTRAPSPCTHPGCPALTTSPRCPTHQKQDQQRRHQETRWVYSTSRWRTLRRQVLRDQPYCNVPGCTQPATDVDHIEPLIYGGDPFDRANIQPLCKQHHSRKTQQEIFGFKG